MIQSDLSDVLTWTEPVRRELAHRVSGPTYITSIIPEGEGCRCAALDSTDPLHRASDPAYYDILPFAEIMRQGGDVMAHVWLSVPMAGYRFMMKDVNLRVIDRAGLLASETAKLSLSYACTDSQYRPDRALGRDVLYSTRFLVSLWRGDLEFAQGGGTLLCLPDAIYDRLQPKVRLSPMFGPLVALAPRMVGRKREADVLLYQHPVNGRRLVKIDLRQTVFFDHWLGHLPGIVLCEVFRQAAYSVAGPESVIVGFRGKFFKMVHPDDIVECNTIRLDNDTVRVELYDRRDRDQIAAGTVSFAPEAARKEPS